MEKSFFYAANDGSRFLRGNAYLLACTASHLNIQNHDNSNRHTLGLYGCFEDSLDYIS